MVDITWTWNEPEDNGAAIDEYEFQWREEGDSWSGNLHTLTSRLYVQRGAREGVTYEARARASNRVGTGEWSMQGKFTPGVAAPRNFRGTGTGTSVAWRWDAVTGATAYRLETRQGNASWRGSNLGSGSTTSTTFHSAGTEVDARVRASIGNITGNYALATAAIVPAIPGRMRTATTTATITWSWDEPGNGGSAITGYTLQYRRVGASNWETISRQASQRSYTASLGGGQWEGRVRAANSVGNSGWTNVPDGRGTIGVPAPNNFRGTGSGTSVSWSWDAVAGATGYRLETRQGSGAWRGTNLGAGNRTSTTTGHTPGTEVDGRVRAFVSNVTGSYALATAAIIPAIPPGMRATTTSSRITWTWNQPGSGGAPITGYTLQYRRVGASNWETVSRQGSQRSYSAALGGGQWEGRVQATNSVGNSGWSDAFDGRGTIGVPAPTGFSGTGTGTSVAWRWNPVAGATGYRLETRQGSGAWRGQNLGAGATSSTTVGHSAGTEVDGRVRAEIDSVNGSFAFATAAIIPGRPPRPSLSVAADERTITATWSAPGTGGAAITSYDLRYRTPGAASWTNVTGRTSRSYEFTRSAWTEVQVRARNSVGVGEWSVSSNSVNNTRVTTYNFSRTTDVPVSRTTDVPMSRRTAVGGSSRTTYYSTVTKQGFSRTTTFTTYFGGTSRTTRYSTEVGYSYGGKGKGYSYSYRTTYHTTGFGTQSRRTSRTTRWGTETRTTSRTTRFGTTFRTTHFTVPRVTNYTSRRTTEWTCQRITRLD